MKFVVRAFTVAILTCFITPSKSSYLRRDVEGGNDEVAETDPEHRRLNWKFVPKDKVYNDDKWYSDYDDDEVQKVKNSHVADEADRLHSSDICPNSSGSSFKHSHCPSTPDCSSISDHEWGSAKLCLNRAPLPWDKNTFYVVAMKCIPKWENCDKCMCGYMQGNGKCRFYDRSHPDDDRTSIDCQSYDVVKIMGNKFVPHH